MADVKWKIGSNNGRNGYAWDEFTLEPIIISGRSPNWAVVHNGQVIRRCDDLLEAMNYCELVKVRLEQ